MNRRQLLIILIPTFLFVVFWITSNIYHGIVTSTISDSTDIQIKPISPNFDTKTIGKLKQREAVVPIFEISGAIANTPPSQVPTPPISTSSAKTGSSGGNLSQ